ncbi:MAG: hypothetical protein LBR70_04945 [Lactobacillaceae bacterium]|jgi:hypothetical protein|nr:hypothetical protein [Lactobacillaceae bacterium]
MKDNSERKDVKKTPLTENIYIITTGDRCEVVENGVVVDYCEVKYFAKKVFEIACKNNLSCE